MINGIIKDGKMKLHVFVDHEEEELAEQVPIEVVAPMLFLSQTPSEVEIQYSEEDLPQHTSQPSINEPRSDELVEQAAVQQPHQAARKSTRQPRRQTARQPWKQLVRQPPQQLEQQLHDDEEADEEYLDMSDFEVTDGEEEYIFTEKEDNVVCEAREETNKWFRTWDKASTLKDGGDPINDLDAESDDSETFQSMDSEEEEDEGEGPRR
jgi:hypothetical protein